MEENMANNKLRLNGYFGRIIGSILILLFFSSCSTMMNVNAVDLNGREIDQATVLVDGLNIGKTPNAMTKVSNAVWDETEIRVVAEGFRPTTKIADKEIKVGTLIIGLVLIWIPLLWVYGPKAQQTVVLTPEQ
jgi:hypothetical protein